MIQFICYFLPACFALHFDNRVPKSSSTITLEDLSIYSFYVLVINSIVYLFFFLFTEHKERFLPLEFFNVSLALKYMVFGTALSWLVPKGISFIRKLISIELEVEKFDEKD